MKMNADNNIKILAISFIVSIMILSGCTAKDVTTSVPQVTTPIQSDIPTYSDILKTYPTGSDICDTNINLDEKDKYGNWKLSSGILRIGNMSGSRVEVLKTFTWTFSKDYLKCYGAKFTINSSDRFEIDGVTYEPGAKLTVNKDLQWVEVSSWN